MHLRRPQTEIDPMPFADSLRLLEAIYHQETEARRWDAAMHGVKLPR